MIGQAICTAGFLALGVGLAIIGALFVVSAFATLVMLGTQVWS